MSISIPLELQHIEKDELIRITTPLDNDEQNPDYAQYHNIIMRTKEMVNLRRDVINNPEIFTEATEPYIKLALRHKVRELNSHIKHGIDIEDNTLLRDKYLSILPVVDEDEVDYFIKMTVLSKNRQKTETFGILDGMLDKDIILNNVISLFSSCCDAGQYSEYNEQSITSKVKSIRNEIDMM